MAISQLYPNQRPTLNLNFARSKTLDPRITFSRGNCAGTYVGSDGLIKTAAVDEPRFDHDPVTGECLGLLVEEQRENLIGYSADFQNQWTIGGSGTGGSATNNQALAPDGTSTAAKYAAPATRYLTKSTNLSSLPNTGVKFNLATGAYHSTLVGTPTDYDIEPYGNGWYRCWFSVSNTTFSVFAKKGELDYISIQLLNSNGFLYAVNATSNQTTTSDGIYIWGAQIEAGTFPTSYIPTSGSTCTRNADEVEITGTNFSSWYNGGDSFESTWVVSGTQLNTTNGVQAGVEHPFCDMHTLMTPKRSNTTKWSCMQAHQVRILDYNVGSTPAGVPVKLALAYKTGFVSMAVQNILSAQGSINHNMFTGNNELRIGRSNNTSGPWNGVISQLSYYPTVLTNSQLQELTR